MSIALHMLGDQISQLWESAQWNIWLPQNQPSPNWCPSGQGSAFVQSVYRSAAGHHASQCPSKVRVGGEGDGGKIVCPDRLNTARNRCLVYSLGSANSFGFEDEVVSRYGCEVHTFDCTLGEAPSRLPRNVYFHNYCIGRVNETRAMKSSRGGHPGIFVTLEDARRKLGHASRTIDLLKMDIERYEFDVVAGMDPARAPTQMVFEVHVHNGYGAWGRPVSRYEWQGLWKKLWQANYTTFSFEPNPKCTCCCEFSVVRAIEGSQA